MVWRNPSAFIVYGRRYDAGGKAVTDQFTISSPYTYTSNFTALGEPVLSLDSSGNAVVLWAGWLFFGASDKADIYGQRLAADGTLSGPQFQLNDVHAGYQGNPGLSATAGGGFVAAWSNWDTDHGGSQSVRARRLAAGERVCISQDQFVMYTDRAALDQSDGSFNANVIRVGDGCGSAAVTVSTQDITAVAGVDYVANSQTIQFADGEVGFPEQKPMQVQVINTGVRTGGEKTLDVFLSDPVGGYLGGVSSEIVTILD
jgi:hypothetical protein